MRRAAMPIPEPAQTDRMNTEAVLRGIDAVTVPVPDLDLGLAFYRDALGLQLRWRNDGIGQAGLALPDGPADLVLALREPYAPAWLVGSAVDAGRTIEEAGGRVVDGPRALPVGNLVVAADPFGNQLVLVDLTTGRYTTDADGRVTGVSP
jgi:catechol 2,3-dioxygenase-like lactoylglutathione lyase family enzyme